MISFTIFPIHGPLRGRVLRVLKVSHEHLLLWPEGPLSEEVHSIRVSSGGQRDVRIVGEPRVSAVPGGPITTVALPHHLPVPRRLVLLRPGLQISETRGGQHGRAHRAGHEHRLRLLPHHPGGGRGREGREEPHDLL